MISSGSLFSTQVPIVNSFTGRHRFLSNFYPSEILVQDKIYPTVEHAYQALKSPLKTQKEWIRTSRTPGEAKRRGRRVCIRDDWEYNKRQVMEDLLRLKFAIPELRRELLNTCPSTLIEGNTWGDTFWGVCDGIGENHLGQLLMKVRGIIK